jgi:demethoxyubiquinone hydroxylase (CLK1/Coq7/Cat5 family)
VKDGVSVFDVPDGEDASMATGDYSESEFYAHAKQIMMNRIGSKAAKDLYNMVLSNGKLNDDWKRFINRLCKTARQRVSHKREFKKKQKEKNFTIVDEEPIADQENIE